VAATVGTVSVVSVIMFATWPEVAHRLRPLLAHTPLGRRPAVSGSERRPPLLLGWAAGATVAAAALFVFVMARAPYVFTAVDDWFNRTSVRLTWVETFAPLDVLGKTHPAVLLAVLVGLATLRCVPFALAYLASVAAGLVVDAVVKTAVSRTRPPNGVLADWTDSFPSGQLIQATLIAGLVPLALLVLTRRRWVAGTAAVGLGLAVALTAILRLHRGVHWWTDTVGGIVIGAAIVLVVWWVLAAGRRHRRCSACPWSGPHRNRPGRRVLVAVRPSLEPGLRWASRGWLLAAVAGFLVLAVTVGLPRNPEGDGFMVGLEHPVQLSLLSLAWFAWLVAWRWEGAAALLLALVGNGLGIFAAVAYHPLVSVLVAAAFLVPAVGFWLVWQHRQDLRAVAAMAVVTAVVVAGTWVGASTVYGHFLGPAHPASPRQPIEVERVEWAWTGGVTTTGATVVAQLVPDARRARLVLQPEAAGRSRTTPYAAATRDNVVRLAVDGLTPDTGYRYAIEVDGVVDGSRGVGRFRTMPEGPSSFTVAFGACARTGSNGAVFDAIAELQPLLYVATGDLHYGNPDRNDVALFGGLYRRVLTAPAQAALYRSVPVAYVWDDHDYGPNDADATASSRPAARAAYRSYVPHYPLPDGEDGAIYQAFSVGRVRFVVTDTRSERTADSMLGAQQLAWLERELVTAGRTHALVVWVNPDPWIATADPEADNWGGYPDERRRIADVIAEAGIRNLVMVSGDAHMVAIDDGTNTDYRTDRSAGGPAGFPLLHAAALDRPGSRKGGPYSEGAFPGAGQFGTLTVTDDGGSVVGVELAGRTWRGEVLVSHQISVTVPQP
jgi:membrane-associated phospholipid phosphatase